MKGLISSWASDFQKIRTKLAEMRLIVEKLGISPLLKDDLREKILIVNRLLNKGRVQDESRLSRKLDNRGQENSRSDD